jgi:hypothetical protein
MKYLFVALISLTATLSFAQSNKFTFKLGTEYDLPRKTEDLSFIGNENDGLVNLSTKKDELTLLKFDYKTLTQTGEKVIPIEEKSKYFVSETLIDFGSNYYWLHSDYDKSTQTEFLNYSVVDIKNATVSSPDKNLFTAQKLASTILQGEYNAFLGTYKMKVVKYEYNFDAAGTRLLVSYRIKPEEKNDKKNIDKIGLYVFDEKMSKLWGGEFTMPYTEAIMDNSDFSVDAEGNAYLLSKVYDSDKRKEKDKETGKAAYHYEVLKFTKQSSQIINTKIEMGDFFIRQATLVENSIHQMVIACTYSKKSTGAGTDGIFLALMGQDGKITKYKNGYYEFPVAELVKFESEREKRRIEKKDDYEAPFLSVRNIVVQADGGLFLALEQNYAVETNTIYYGSPSYKNKSSTSWYYEDIIGVKIGAAGNFEWLKKIPKRQRGDNSGGVGTMSYKMVADASGYYFVYLDNKNNLNLAANEEPKLHLEGYGGQVVVAKINNAGVVTKELLFDTREEEVKIYPSQFKRINGTQFIGRARMKKGGYKPLLITVN